MADRITLTLNVGPRASIQAVSSAVDDIMRVLDFAADLQRRVDRDALIAARVRARGFPPTQFGSIYFVKGAEPEFFSNAGQPADEFERIAARQVDENSRITVERLTYENPLELIILAGGLVTIGILRLLREWPDRRRLNHAVATEYENKVISRQRVRDRILEQIDSGALPLTPELIDTLLTDDVADALGGAACEFVKNPTLSLVGASEGSVPAWSLGGAGPAVVAGEVDVFPAER